MVGPATLPEPSIDAREGPGKVAGPTAVGAHDLPLIERSAALARGMHHASAAGIDHTHLNSRTVPTARAPPRIQTPASAHTLTRYQLLRSAES